MQVYLIFQVLTQTYIYFILLLKHYLVLYKKGLKYTHISLISYKICYVHILHSIYLYIHILIQLCLYSKMSDVSAATTFQGKDNIHMYINTLICGISVHTLTFITPPPSPLTNTFNNWISLHFGLKSIQNYASCEYFLGSHFVIFFNDKILQKNFFGLI